MLHIRIIATGPLFDIDMTVPEKKAATELKKLKKLHDSYAKIECDKRAHEVWSRRARRYLTVRPKFDETNPQRLKIEIQRIQPTQ